jgi:hypothetical protein
MKLISEQNRGCISLSESIYQNERREENYKTIKQAKASMTEESYLVYSRRKSRMHFLKGNKI